MTTQRKVLVSSKGIWDSGCYDALMHFGRVMAIYGEREQDALSFRPTKPLYPIKPSKPPILNLRYMDSHLDITRSTELILVEGDLLTFLSQAALSLRKKSWLSNYILYAYSCGVKNRD